MVKVPVRCKKVSAAFDDVARARLCESSGSEHSAAGDNSAELSELVDLFIERDDGAVLLEDEDHEKRQEDREVRGRGSDSESSYRNQSETKEMLMNLIFTGGYGADYQVIEEYFRLKRSIQMETEIACRSIGSPSSSSAAEGYKRQVMSWLRQRGFDAGN